MKFQMLKELRSKENSEKRLSYRNKGAKKNKAYRYF